MGLLNRKERILDTIITDEGRKQLINGRFIPAFYSFSDTSAVYSSLDTQVSGTIPSSSIATLLSFEAFPLPQDQVSYEADDSGGLRVFPNNNYFDLPAGSIRVISGKLIQGWDSRQPETLAGSAQFASSAEGVLTGSADNFRKLMLLRSPDLLFPNKDNFELNKNAVEFHITDNTYLPGDVTNGTLEVSENLFSDRRLTHLDNFSYLPPINKLNSDNQIPTAIGNYGNSINGNRQILTYEDLRQEFKNVVIKSGSIEQRSLLQKETVIFSQTSTMNRVVGQMFEIANGKITKLDVVDFGVFILKKTDPPLFPDAIPSPLDSERVSTTSRVHVYFVGKVFLDATGNHKFINMFSIVFQ